MSARIALYTDDPDRGGVVHYNHANFHVGRHHRQVGVPSIGRWEDIIGFLGQTPSLALAAAFGECRAA